MKKPVRILCTVFYGLLLAVIVFVAATTLLTKFPISGHRIYIVTSGSMEPAIPVGSLVIIRPQPDYAVGDVVNFAQSGRSNVTVTHRIADIKNGEMAVEYVTKGDANEDPDSELVPATDVLGKLWVTIPYLGYVAQFAKTKFGLMFLVVIPATLLVYSEILEIKSELRRIFRNRTATVRIPARKGKVKARA